MSAQMQKEREHRKAQEQQAKSLKEQKDSICRQYDELKLKFSQLQKNFQQEQIESTENQRLALKLSQAINKYDFALRNMHREKVQTEMDLYNSTQIPLPKPQDKKNRLKNLFQRNKSRGDDFSDSDREDNGHLNHKSRRQSSLGHKNGSNNNSNSPDKAQPYQPHFLREGELLEQVLSPKSMAQYFETLKLNEANLQMKLQRGQNKNSGILDTMTTTVRPGSENRDSGHLHINRSSQDANSQKKSTSNNSNLLNTVSSFNDKPHSNFLFESVPNFNLNTLSTVKADKSSNLKDTSVLNQLSTEASPLQSQNYDKMDRGGSQGKSDKGLPPRYNSSDEEGGHQRKKSNKLKTQEFNRSQLLYTTEPQSFNVNVHEGGRSSHKPPIQKNSPRSMQIQGYGDTQGDFGKNNSRNNDFKRHNSYTQDFNRKFSNQAGAKSMTELRKNAQTPTQQVKTPPAKTRHQVYIDPTGKRHDISHVAREKKQIFQEIEAYFGQDKYTQSQPQLQVGRSVPQSQSFNNTSFVGVNNKQPNSYLSRSFDSTIGQIQRSATPTNGFQNQSSIGWPQQNPMQVQQGGMQTQVQQPAYGYQQGQQLQGQQVYSQYFQGQGQGQGQPQQVQPNMSQSFGYQQQGQQQQSPFNQNGVQQYQYHFLNGQQYGMQNQNKIRTYGY